MICYTCAFISYFSYLIICREITSAPVRRIDEILSLPYSVEEFEGADLPPNDDDSWLYNGEDELNSAILEREKEMQAYESKKKEKNVKQEGDEAGGSSSKINDFNLGDIAASMQEFVRKVSSFEGAEVPDNRFSLCFLFCFSYFIISQV